MRSITLKTVTVNPPGRDPQQMPYAEMIKVVCTTQLEGERGFAIEAQRRVFRVLDALDAVDGDELRLEDADWEFLKGRVEAFPFAWPDRAFMRFSDDVANAPTPK